MNSTGSNHQALTVNINSAGAPIHLHWEDCLSGMRNLPAGLFELIVTSPPYNLGIEYGSYDDNLSRSEYLSWTDQWLTEVSRLLAPQGSFFLNISGKPKDPWVPFDVLQVARYHFTLQNTLHWIKSIHIPQVATGKYGILSDDLTVGHYKPINSPRFVNDCHEYVFHLTHQGDVPLDRLAIGAPYQDKSNVTRWQGSGKDLHCRGNTWFVPYRTIRSRQNQRPHPASFPIELAGMCLDLHGRERINRVLDPFLGIGHSALAALQRGLEFDGFEIDPDYFDEAEKRIRESLSAAGNPAGRSRKSSKKNENDRKQK